MAENEVKLSAAQQKIVDELNKLSALELSQVVKHLEEEWGVSAAAPAAVVAAPAADGAAAAADEKTEFTVTLKDVDKKLLSLKLSKTLRVLDFQKLKLL